MEFRWVAAIALWTILSGPIFNGKSSHSAPSPDRASASAAKPSAPHKNSPSALTAASKPVR